jgi:cohesin complex subunit SA-1/2
MVIEEKEMKLPVEAVKSCVLGCYYGLIWDKYRLENCEQRGQTIKATDVQNLQDNFNSYITTMKQMINMNITGPGCCLKEESFVSICDLLIFFSNEKLKKNGLLSQLFYEPDENLPTELNIFVQTNVFVPDDEDAEDEQDDHKKIEELHKRRNFLSCFCKLIVYSVIPMQSAADVFKHYSTFYNDFGDIIKETLR